MFNYGGYAGRLLYINLSTKEIRIEKLCKEFAEDYIGGNGFGAKLLFDMVPAGVDPLGPDNVLIFTVGPLQGTGLPAVSSRSAIITKSPLTGFFIDSYFGGQFGAELKYAGYDALVISGKSPNPVYIWVDDDKVELRDASHLWGLKTFETQIKLKREIGDENIAVAVIGPSGENQSLISCTISGVRAAGRGGTGAVLGSKNLKAIALRGSHDVKVTDIMEAQSLMRKLNEKIRSNPGTGVGLPSIGTIGVVNVANNLGILGTNNWQTEFFHDAVKIGPESAKEFILKHDTCFCCSIACGKLTKTKKQEYFGASTIGPEYETLWSFGSNCGVNDIEAIILADRLCDEYGIDTISLGTVIAFVMECYEKGLINEKFFEGISGTSPVFGNKTAMLQMVKLAAVRKGVGDKLVNGVKRLAEEIGKGSERFAIHAKGLEIPAHSARGIPGMAVGYATSNRGGSHQDGRPTAERVGLVDINQIKGKGYFQVDVQRMTTIADCFINCRMTESILGIEGITQDYADLINIVTGMNKSINDLITVADRVYALERAFNIREGASRKDDTIPYRFTHEPIPDGPSKGKYLSEDVLNNLVDEVYEKRGYDKKTGAPTKETLKNLKLDFVIDELYKD